jgi:hypothetical protein
VNGTVNPGEPLLNVVRTNQPKTLSGLSHKARGREYGLASFPTVDRRATGAQAGPPPVRDTDAERGKPTRRPHGKAHRKGSGSAWG